MEEKKPDEAEWEREMRVRQVLEEIARGTTVTDSLLVPLMEANRYDVTGCVEALLDMINADSHSVELEQRELDEELQFYEQCRHAAADYDDDFSNSAEASSQDEPSARPDAAQVISEELRRKEELDEHRRQIEAEERARFAAMRRSLESEWLQRLEDQKRELAAKQQALEEERQATLAKQLEAVTVSRSPDFKQQVEEALKQRLAEKQQADTTALKKRDVAGGAPHVELTCPNQAEMGAKITVFWEYVGGKPSMSDWIGYYKKSRPEDSNQYYTYHKTGGGEKGKLEFIVPSKLGICELRMFQNNDYKIIGRSQPIRVGNSVQLEASVTAASTPGISIKCVYSNKSQQHSSWDWIAIYEADEKDNRKYIKSSYVTQDVTAFDLRKPGKFIARYFQSGSGYSELAESNVFEIADNDWLKVTTPAANIARNTTVEVAWNVESIKPSSKDRVGLFRAGEPFNPLLPLAIQATHCNMNKGTLKFLLSPGLAPGKFEFVFMARGSSKPLKKSEPFEVK